MNEMVIKMKPVKVYSRFLLLVSATGLAFMSLTKSTKADNIMSLLILNRLAVERISITAE